MYDDYAAGGYYAEGVDPYYGRAAPQAKSLVGRKYEGMEVGAAPRPSYSEYAEFDYPVAAPVAAPVVMDEMYGDEMYYGQEPIMIADQGPRMSYSQRYGLPQAQMRVRPQQVIRQQAPVIVEEPPMGVGMEVMPQDIMEDPLATPGFRTVSETVSYRRVAPGASGRLSQPPVSVSDEEWASLVPAHQPPPRHQPPVHHHQPRPRMERSASSMVVGGSGRPDRGAQFVDGDSYNNNRNTIHIHSGGDGHNGHNNYGSPTAMRPSQGSLPISPTGSESRRTYGRPHGSRGTRSSSAGPRY